MEKVAVVGASPKPDRYSNKAIHMLKEYHHTPLPVAPGHETIEGLKTYPDLGSLEETVDTVTLYLKKERQDAVIDQIVKLKPKRVIFNPDTENPEAADKLKQAGINVVEACTLVLLRTGQY